MISDCKAEVKEPSQLEVVKKKKHYLGHVVSEYSVSTDPEKNAMVKE